MPPHVYVSRRVPERVRAELDTRFEADLREEEAPPARAELLAASAGMDGLLTVPGDRVDAELLDAAGAGLQVVANYAVGTDNVDVEAATARGVLVTNTPDVLTAATAELTLALAPRARAPGRGGRPARAERRAVGDRADVHARERPRREDDRHRGRGRIGGEVARLAGPSGWRCSRRVAAEAGRVPLGELLAAADVVSIHSPAHAGDAAPHRR